MGYGPEATHRRITNDPTDLLAPPQPSTCNAITSPLRERMAMAQVYGLWRKEWLLRHEGVLLV